MDKENINIDSQEVSQENIVEVASGSSDPAFSSHENEYHNWYMLHTYSGFEMRVEKQINELKRTAQDEGLIHQVLLPTEKLLKSARTDKEEP